MIDYTKQKADKYLNETVVVDFNREWSCSNHIDTSLDYRIDALGGGVDNPAPVGNGMPYTGELGDFMKQSPGSEILLPSSFTHALIFSSFMVLTVAILVRRRECYALELV